jgi:Lar family restriction alleviation protein
MKELKPCPFCGGKAYSSTYKNDQQTVFSIGCNTNGCIMENGHEMWYASPETAIDAWNTRIPMSKLEELIDYYEREIIEHNSEYQHLTNLKSEKLVGLKTELGVKNV